MKIRKILAAITSVALVGTMLAGCNNDGNSGSSNNPASNNSSTGTGDNSSTPAPATENPEKDVKLKVWYSQAEKDMIEAMCNKFKEEHPDQNIEFTFGVCEGNNAKEQIQKDPEAAADVFFYAPDHTAEMVASKVICEVTRNKDDIVNRNLKPSIDNVSVDGKLYGYPVNSKTYFMYYNKSMFTEDEVKSLDTMLAKNIEGVQYNFCMPLLDSWYTPSVFFAAGCNLMGENGDDPTSCDFNSDKGVNAANTLIDLFANPKFSPDKAEFTEQYKDMFAQKKMAACVIGTWKAADFQEALGDDYGVTVLPKIKLADGTEAQLSGFSQYNAVGVKAGSQFPITAMDLADYLTNKENQKIRFDTISDSPTNKELAEDSAALSANAAVAANAAQCAYTKLQSSVSQMGKYWTNMDSFTAEIKSGVVTKDNVKEKLDVTVEAILSTGLSE